MAMGLIGRKLGMTRIFAEDGTSIPVTVVHVESCRVTQIKREEIDKYRAVQVTSGFSKPSRVNKPIAGHYAKAKVEVGRGLWEFRLDKTDETDIEKGSELGVELFSAGQRVDVVGINKGKGFAGAIKRHNFRGQDNSHGNSLSHRAPGSIGQNQTPGRVFKGKKMAGHLGNVRTTVQNLEIARVDEQRKLLLIKGAVPGSRGGNVVVKPATKAKG
jgi:large subunit ribosomal protein L3